MIKLIVLIIIVSSIVVDRTRPGSNNNIPEQGLPSSFDSGYHSVWVYHDVINQQFTNINQAITLFKYNQIDVIGNETIFNNGNYVNSDGANEVTGFKLKISSKDYPMAKKLGWIYCDECIRYTYPYHQPYYGAR